MTPACRRYEGRSPLSVRRLADRGWLPGHRFKVRTAPSRSHHRPREKVETPTASGIFDSPWLPVPGSEGEGLLRLEKPADLELLGPNQICCCRCLESGTIHLTKLLGPHPGSVCNASRSPNATAPSGALGEARQYRSPRVADATRNTHAALCAESDRTQSMSLMRHIARLSFASVSPMCMYFLRFVRTVVLSHLLSPNDLGAAVALMSILAGCELITDVGLDKFVIVTDGTDRAQAVAAAQQIAIGRAILLSAAIAIFSPALAQVFGASDHARGIAWLGLVPLIASFRNWRAVQILQDYRYGPDAVASVSGQVAAVIMTVPGYMWFHDERALLVSLVADALVHVVLSHLLVRRERVAAVDPSIRMAAIKWGLPLMVNGIGLLALGQLDRVIVANLFDLQTLALYALGLNLAITPTSPLGAIAGRISLPFMGNARGNPQASRQASLLVALWMACVAAAYALPMGPALDRLVPLLYGRQYQVTEAFCALAMVTAFLRFCRVGPNTILLNHGLTSRLTVGNLVAGVGMLVGLALGVWSRRLEGVMVGLVIGDLLSLIVLVCLLHRHLSITTALAHIGLLTATIGIAAAVLWAGGDLTIGERVLVFIVGGLPIGIDAIFLYRRNGRGLATPSDQAGEQIVRTVIPAPRRTAVAATVVRSEPPTQP